MIDSFIQQGKPSPPKKSPLMQKMKDKYSAQIQSINSVSSFQTMGYQQQMINKSVQLNTSPIFDKIGRQPMSPQANLHQHTGLTARFKDVGNGLEFNESLADEIIAENQAEFDRQ